MGSDDMLPAVEAVRRAVLSPDDLLGFNLLFVRSQFFCHNTRTDNNLNFTQVYSTKLYQENTRVLSLTAVGKIARLAWFAGRPYSVLGTPSVHAVYLIHRTLPRITFISVHPLRSSARSSVTLGQLL